MNFIYCFNDRFRYNNPEESEHQQQKFKLSLALRSSLQPSIYRRTAILAQSFSETEHVILLRWSGNTDIDPGSLLHLIKET